MSFRDLKGTCMMHPLSCISYIGAFIARIDTSSQHLDYYVFDSHNLEK